MEKWRDKMNTMPKIIVWIAILAGIFFLSDFLISVGLNSTYKDIARKDKNSEIVVYQADATYVNGRIRGLIKNTNQMQDGDKYLKISLYSKRDVLVGNGYIALKDLRNDETQPFELLFKATDVSYYKAEMVKEKQEGNELEILPKEWTKPEVLLFTAMSFLIFWG